MEQVKLIGMTTLLTLLIWVSADSLVNETGTLRCLLVLSAEPGASSMVPSVDENHRTFEIEISGPRKSIEALTNDGPLPIRLTLGDRPTGPTYIELDRELGRAQLEEQVPELQKVTIVAMRPNHIPIMVDHIVSRTVDVTLTGLTGEYESPPQVDPPVARLFLRESVLEESEQSGAALAFDISTEVDNRFRVQRVGDETTLRIPLDVSAFGADARTEPKYVEVTAIRAAKITTAEIAAVPILFAMSAESVPKAVTPLASDGTPIGLLTRSIQVRGPIEDVQRLLRGETQAFGIIRLKSDDFDDLNRPKIVTPVFHLPERLTHVDTPELVEFRLVPANGGTE